MKPWVGFVFALAGCKGETKTVEKTVTETVIERDLLLGTCLLTLTPPGPGTGHTSVAVIETADGKRYRGSCGAIST
jgi:hypothetical protein